MRPYSRSLPLRSLGAPCHEDTGGCSSRLGSYVRGSLRRRFWSRREAVVEDIAPSSASDSSLPLPSLRLVLRRRILGFLRTRTLRPWSAKDLDRRVVSVGRKVRDNTLQNQSGALGAYLRALQRQKREPPTFHARKSLGGIDAERRRVNRLAMVHLVAERSTGNGMYLSASPGSSRMANTYPMVSKRQSLSLYLPSTRMLKSGKTKKP